MNAKHQRVDSAVIICFDHYSRGTLAQVFKKYD